MNITMQADFYKVGHIFQYPEGTEFIYSNFTARSAEKFKSFQDQFDNKVVFFGLQAFIQKYLVDGWNEFFSSSKEEATSKYFRRMKNSIGPINISHFEALHDLGYLPLIIKALPEGSRVNIGVPMFTIINTDPRFFWLTNYLETMLSAEVWKTCTSATIAHQYRRLFDSYAIKTGTPKEFVQWQGHDFSMRGMDGIDSAARSGAAHLLSFTGTDTIPAIDFLEEFYLANSDQELIGGSVPATEHSVMSAGGQIDERETFRRLITEVYPGGIVSIVSDTWDFWNVLSVIAPSLKEEILARTPDAFGMAKVVFRPDSGDPVKIVAGYKVAPEGTDSWDIYDEGYEAMQVEGKYYEVEFDYDYDGSVRGAVPGKELTEVEVKGAVEVLWDNFGGTITDKGFKQLNARVGLIYGDSITPERAEAILKGLAEKGFASGNIVFGIGSYTYQYNTRDTFGFAMKATWAQVKGVGRELFKNPKTDNGTKKSAKGLLRVDKIGDDFVLIDQVSLEEADFGQLKPVFRDGIPCNIQSLKEIRERLANG